QTAASEKADMPSGLPGGITLGMQPTLHLGLQDGLVLQRSRRLVQSSPAVIARPMQAASASTRKSPSLACLPGTQSCRISSTPIATTDMAEVSSRCRE